MAINQTVNTFITTVSARDMQRDNLYRIVSLKCEGLTLTEEDQVYCRDFKISGREVPHSAVKYMGIDFNYSQSTVKYPDAGDFSFNMLIDAKGEIMRKLESANRTLFNDASTTGNWRFPSTGDILTVARLNINLEVEELIHYYGLSFKSYDAVDAKPATGEGVAQEVPVHFTYLYFKRTGSDVVYSSN